MKTSTLKERFKGDPAIWISIVILCVYSLLVVYSSTGLLSFVKHGGNTEHYLIKQGFIIAIGLFLMWFVHKVKWYPALKKSALTLLILGWALLLFTLIYGMSINEASRWIKIPFIGLTFQPSDLVKAIFVIYLATVLADLKSFEGDFKKMLKKVYLPLFVTCGLIFPSNFSTMAILFCISIVILIFSRASFKTLATITGVAFSVLLILFCIYLINPKAIPRSKTWGNRYSSFTLDSDSEERPDQVVQAEIAIATGGLFGKGPGRSVQRNILPHPYSDFIFAIIIEEYGLIFGAIPIVILYLILLFRGIHISLKSRRRFSSIMVFGIVFMCVFQGFINMLVSVGLAPVTGQTLPFVSMGGTALIINCIAFGLVLSESRINEEEEIKEVEDIQNVKVEEEGKKLIKQEYPEIELS